MNRVLVSVVAAWCIAALSVTCYGATAGYPDKPIRMIVPFPPGGPTDIVARIIGQKFTERWGQQVVIDNRAGAAGTIGAEIAARAVPDGYTLVMGSTANMAINVSLYRKLPYDPIKDFAPINLAAVTPNLLVVHPGFPAGNVKEFIAVAKAKRGSINYATGGTGTPSHLAAELFKTMAGVEMNHVPYKGSIPALTDIMAGQVTLMFGSMASPLPFHKSGKLKAVAQSGAKRSPAVPDVPTISESGLPGYHVAGWVGVLAPAGTPREIVNKLAKEITQILSLPEVKERYAALGTEPGPATPEDFSAFLKAEITKWAKVIKDSGARID